MHIKKSLCVVLRRTKHVFLDKGISVGSVFYVGVVNLSKSVARGFPVWNPCDVHVVRFF